MLWGRPAEGLARTLDLSEEYNTISQLECRELSYIKLMRMYIQESMGTLQVYAVYNILYSAKF